MEDYTFDEETTSENGKQKKLIIALIAIAVVLAGALAYIW
jgi:flagellar basal body-associated protein FliL